MGKKKEKEKNCVLVPKTLIPGQNTFLVLFGSGAPSVVGFTLPACKPESTSAFFEFGFRGSQQSVPGPRSPRPRLSDLLTSPADPAAPENRLGSKGGKSREADKGKRAQTQRPKEETQRLGGSSRRDEKALLEKIGSQPRAAATGRELPGTAGRCPPQALPPLSPGAHTHTHARTYARTHARTHARARFLGRAERAPKVGKRVLGEAPPLRGLPAGGFSRYAVTPARTGYSCVCTFSVCRFVNCGRKSGRVKTWT